MTHTRQNTKNKDVTPASLQCATLPQGTRTHLQLAVSHSQKHQKQRSDVGALWLGYLEEFPDYWTQGETLDELQENLKDLYQELTSDNILEVRRVAELQVS